MSKLFETTAINGMYLPNRFVRSATWEGMAARDGAVTPRLITTMTSLASGGVGLIVGSHSFISPEGQATPWQLGIHKDELIPGLREMATAVHEFGGKIIMQLAHGGCFASEQLTRRPLLVVSEFEGLTSSACKEMTIQDIPGVVEAFADAARRAREAGFDGVQIHSAHGYLLSQFLSPAFNRRRDSYGGTIRNRVRIHLEVCKAVREVVGKNFPVLMKMNCQDFVENGLNVNDSLEAACILAENGLDALELSGGLLKNERLSPSRQGINREEKEAYFREFAREFKKRIQIPLILVGGIRSFAVAEQLVEDGIADYISMSRPFIREPDLINRWKAGDRRPAECLSDNLCFNPGFAGEGICCPTAQRQSKPG